MKRTGILLTMAVAATLTGCSTLVSLHQFVTGQQTVFDPALLGTWSNAAEDETYIVRRDDEGYKIRRIHDAETQVFSAQLFKAGDLRILDLVSTVDDPFQVPVHTPMRIWLDGATLRFALLDTAWIKENARKHLGFQEVGDRVLITAPGDAVLQFLVTYGAADAAYGKPVTLQK